MLDLTQQRSSHYSDLATGSDSFKYAGIYNDPGEEEAAEEFPLNAACLFNATGLLQELVTGKREK